MEESLSLALRKGVDFAELAQHKSSRNIIDVVDGKLKELSAGSRELNSARVLINGKWGLAYSYKNEPKQLIMDAMKNAKSSDFSMRFEPLKPIKRKFITGFKKNPDDYSLEQKRDDALRLIKKQNGISSLRMLYSDSRSEINYSNTEGSELKWNDVSSGILCWAFAKKGPRTENFLEIYRIKGGYELMDRAIECRDNAIKKSKMMLNAKKPKGEIANVVMDQKLGGVLAHEAIGHACEADLVLNNSSILQGMIGKRIGNELVSITDNGLLQEWGYMPFDSEGVLGSRNVLVQNGVLKKYMQNRETASILNARPTGNGRAMNPACKAIVRMTNTYFENGDSNFDEVIREARNGYYLKGSAGGQVDPASGEFLFNALEGYEIVNGEIGNMLKSASLTGNIKETLYNIRLVADDLGYGTGFCGKSGQNVPVGDGAPHILILNARVGGE